MPLTLDKSSPEDVSKGRWRKRDRQPAQKIARFGARCGLGATGLDPAGSQKKNGSRAHRVPARPSTPMTWRCGPAKEYGAVRIREDGTGKGHYQVRSSAHP